MKLQITIDGKQYEADIEVLEEERSETAGGRSPSRPPPPLRGGATPASPPSAVAKAAPPVPAAPAAPASGDKVCKSSIVGIVFKVLVAPGQTVAVGETLLVLEAMKMESNVSSPLAGKVKAVLAAPGDSVKKGQVLVEFE